MQSQHGKQHSREVRAGQGQGRTGCGKRTNSGHFLAFPPSKIGSRQGRAAEGRTELSRREATRTKQLKPARQSPKVFTEPGLQLRREEPLGLGSSASHTTELPRAQSLVVGRPSLALVWLTRLARAATWKAGSFVTSQLLLRKVRQKAPGCRGVSVAHCLPELVVDVAPVAKPSLLSDFRSSKRATRRPSVRYRKLPDTKAVTHQVAVCNAVELLQVAGNDL